MENMFWIILQVLNSSEVLNDFHVLLTMTINNDVFIIFPFFLLIYIPASSIQYEIKWYAEKTADIVKKKI